MLSKKLKELRESNGFVQREVASVLEVDTAYMSKIENNEKPVSRDSLLKLAKFYNYPIEELTALWLSERLFKVISGEDCAMDALKITMDRIKEEQ